MRVLALALVFESLDQVLVTLLVYVKLAGAHGLTEGTSFLLVSNYPDLLV